MPALITFVGINFLPEIILIYFHWEQADKLERGTKMFTSPSVCTARVDTAAEWPTNEICG
jgi:hypothetical protein